MLDNVYPDIVTGLNFSITLLAPSYNIFLLDATSGDVHIFLPGVISAPGMTYTFARIDTSINTVFIEGNSHNINGAAFRSLASGITAVITSQNDTWNIIGGTLGSPIQTGILPVINGGTGVASLTSGNVLVGNGTNDVIATKTAPTGAFVGTTDTQTLTNKTITGATNTVDANSLRNGSTWVTPITGSIPTARQILYNSGTGASWTTWKLFTATTPLSINTTTETSLFNPSAPSGSLSIPDSISDLSFIPGRTARIRIVGRLTLIASTAITFTYYVAGSGQASTFTAGALINDQPFVIDAFIIFQTVGSSGTYTRNLTMTSSNDNGTPSPGVTSGNNTMFWGAATGSIESIDTTSATAVDITATLSTVAGGQQISVVMANLYWE